jgi:hypothetical protein
VRFAQINMVSERAQGREPERRFHGSGEIQEQARSSSAGRRNGRQEERTRLSMLGEKEEAPPMRWWSSG